MRNFLITVLLLFTITAAADVRLSEIRETLKWVESGYNPDAVGDYVDGVPQSYGILQIKHIAIRDVNRKYGTKYTHQDAFDEACAEEIFNLYIKMWTAKLQKREGRPATPEDIVRIWNGGPRGYEKDSTIKHYNKYLRVRKNRYLCRDESKGEQPKMYYQWTPWYYNPKVYPHG